MILENVEIYYPRLIEDRPNSRFNKENPTWEVQGRTRSKKVKAEWEEIGFRVKIVEDSEGVYYRVNFKKKSRKADGNPAKPVTVVDRSRKPFDPKFIGNGTIANLLVNTYEYGPDNKMAFRLDGVQIVKLVEYVPEDREDFANLDEGEDSFENAVPFNDEIDI